MDNPDNMVNMSNMGGMDEAGLRKLMAKVAEAELGETEQTREAALAQFKEWALNNPDIHNYNGEDNFALLYLRKGKFSVHRTQEIFLKSVAFKNNFCHFMKGADVKDPKIGMFTRNGYVYASPFTDDSGCHFIILQHSKIDTSKCEYVDHVRAQVATAVTMMHMEVPQVLGVKIIVNLANVTAAQYTHVPLPDLLSYVKETQQTVPLRFKGFYFVNMPTPVKWLFDLIVSHATEKMRGRFKAVGSLEELHSLVPSRCLPKELGGVMPEQQMIDLWQKPLLAARDEILRWDRISVTQPNNGDLKKALNELPGTFRKLEVD